MSREVNPQNYVRHFEGVTKKDGKRGYLVTKHWIVWVQFGVVLVLLSVLTGMIYMWDAVLGIALGAVSALSLFVWRYIIIRTRLLVTRRGAFYTHLSKLEFDTDPMWFNAAVGLKIESEGWNIVRSKRVVISKGDRDTLREGETNDIRYKHAAGGNAMSRAVIEFSGESIS